MFRVRVNTGLFQRQLSKLEKQQIPFATARALTWVALDAQKEVRRQLPRRFKIKNSWVSKGIRITPAKKHRLVAEVYTKDYFMERQEEGGTKRPRVGKHIAIAPTRGQSHHKVTTPKGLIKKNMRPTDLLDKPNEYFKGTHKGVYGIWKRVGRSRKRRGSFKGSIALMYVLKPKAPVEGRWQFETTINDVASRRFSRLFQLSFDQAVKH